MTTATDNLPQLGNRLFITDGGLETLGLINDTEIDLDAEGAFEIRLGGPEQARNWLGIPPEATRVTTRHYFEEVLPAAANPAKDPEFQIERVGAPYSEVSTHYDDAVWVGGRLFELLPLSGPEKQQYLAIDVT